MQSCDVCPNSADCAGTNLHPVLVKVFDLYHGGTTDKFDILFALDPADEALLEQYAHRVSRSCWTKAALLAIADIIARQDPDPDAVVADVRGVIGEAVDAFDRFPWNLPNLVDAAPQLLDMIHEASESQALRRGLTRRNFTRMCKDIAYRA